MNNLRLLISISIVFLLSNAVSAGTRRPATAFPAHYEGGSAALKQNHTVKAVVAGDALVFVQHGRRISVPVQSIDQISCATDVRRRFGATVLGLVPLVDLDKVETHYVALAWRDNSEPGANHEMVFKLSAGDSRDFVSTLERLTGKRAVDTKETPSVVRYGL